MDLGSAVVALAVGAITVLPRVPALSTAGRAQAAIQRDAELWAAIPGGEVRDRLAEQIEVRTIALLVERERDKTVENGWLYGTAWIGAAWVILVASTAISSLEAWAGPLRAVLQLAGLGMGALGALILALTSALVVWRGGLRSYLYLRARRRSPESGYEI